MINIFIGFLGHSQVRQSEKYRNLHRVHFWFEAKISSGYISKAKSSKTGFSFYLEWILGKTIILQGADGRTESLFQPVFWMTSAPTTIFNKLDEWRQWVTKKLKSTHQDQNTNKEQFEKTQDKLQMIIWGTHSSTFGRPKLNTAPCWVNMVQPALHESQCRGIKWQWSNTNPSSGWINRSRCLKKENNAIRVSPVFRCQ